MVRCNRCQEEIVGKKHNSVIYAGIWIPVLYCNSCYHDIQSQRENIGSIIAFFMFTIVIFVIFGILVSR